jgi:hypothetical protein
MKVVVCYYLLMSGFALNALVLGICLYDRSIFDKVTEKLEAKLRLSIDPNAEIDKEKQLISQLENEIELNFGQWQPLLDKYTIQPGLIKVGDLTYSSLIEAGKNLHDNQVMFIGEGTYREPLVIRKSNITVVGVGRVTLDGASAEGKAAIITKGDNIALTNIECKNISVPDQNGACIRSEGKSLKVDHVYFHDSEQGILSSGNEYLRITNSRFEKLGKNGQAHGIYIDSGDLFIDKSSFIAAVSEGHEIKSRARKTIITSSVIASLSSLDSRLLDIPNGGELIVSNSVLEKGPQSSNATAIGYGLEGMKYNNNSISLSKNVIILERDGPNKLLDARTGGNIPITVNDNTIISKDELETYGVNWQFTSRKDALIEDYPRIPVSLKSR